MPCRDEGALESYLGGKVNALTNMLCGLATRVEARKGLQKLIDADPTLAKWWKEHKRKDRREKALEKADAERSKLATSARRKLTKQELEALGIR